MNGLKKYDAVAKKQLFEKQFNEAIGSNPAQKEKYGNIFPQLQKVYAEYKVLNKQVDYYSECLMAIDAFNYARFYVTLNNELKKKQKGSCNKFYSKGRRKTSIRIKRNTKHVLGQRHKADGK